MNHDGSSFLSACCVTCKYFFFAKELDSVAEGGSPNSSFFVFDEDDDEEQYRKYDESVNWPAISMAMVKPAGGKREIVAIGPNGNLWELQTLSLGQVVDRIPKFSGSLRKVSTVSDTVFACGMGRVVLERKSHGVWDPIGPPPRADDAEVIGFEDIDGFDRSEMYAVGWGGDIWSREDGVWRRIDSPTSSLLTSIHCGSDGFVYVAGHDGTLLKGRGDDWQLVEISRTDTFRDLALYRDALYLVSDSRIFKQVGNTVAPETDFVDRDRPVTCLHLLLAPDGLISVGNKDVFRKQGGSWSRLV